MKPIILVTAGTRPSNRNMDEVFLYRNYEECILKEGGIPLIVGGMVLKEETGRKLSEKDIEELAGRADGLFLTGGGDISPEYFGQENEQTEEIYDCDRDRLEYHLCRVFMNMEKPVLGVCRGFQMINVVCKGTLHQDIQRKLGIVHPDASMHPVVASKGSWWEKVYGSEFSVNSFHHQAVDLLGEGLEAAAFDKASGIVEAFEHKKLPVMGVQWHPERMIGQKPYTQGGPDMGKYIHRFVERCG